MHRVGLGLGVAGQAYREGRQAGQHRIDHAGGVDADRRFGMVEARPHLAEALAGFRQLAVPGEDADAFAGEPLVDLGVGRVRPHQQLAAAQLLVPAGADEPAQLLDEPHLVCGDPARGTQVEQDASGRIQAELAAERLAAGQVGGWIEPLVEERRAGDLDALGRHTVDLDGVLQVMGVPDEQPVRRDLDQALGGEVVPAQHWHGGRHAQAPGGLDVVGLLGKAEVCRADQHDVRRPLADEAGHAGVGRGRRLGDAEPRLRDRRGQQRPHQGVLRTGLPGFGQIFAPALDIIGRGPGTAQVAGVGAQLAAGEEAVAALV